MLALDIGNGSIKYGVFENGRRVDGGRVALDADPPPAETCVAVSVNPPALARLRESRAVAVVGQDLPLGIDVHYEPPGDCGPDRVMGVVGALHRRPEAEAVLVLDSGTCLTATLGVRGKGVMGGAIAPGVDLMARALAEGTHTLPLVEPARPVPLLGRSTESSIRTGLWASFVGAAREIVRGLRAEADVSFDVVAVGTGGGALAEALPEEIDAVVPFATLWGVYLAAAASGA